MLQLYYILEIPKIQVYCLESIFSFKPLLTIHSISGNSMKPFRLCYLNCSNFRAIHFRTFSREGQISTCGEVHEITDMVGMLCKLHIHSIVLGKLAISTMFDLCVPVMLLCANSCYKFNSFTVYFSWHSKLWMLSWLHNFESDRFLLKCKVMVLNWKMF